MYVAIDAEKMSFLYVHFKLRTVAQLVWIQNPDIATILMDVDQKPAWEKFTLTELNLLYRNATGEMVGMYSREKIIQILTHTVNTMPIADVSLFELGVQADSIKDGDDEYYRYVKGQGKPIIVDTLYTDRIRVKRNAETNELLLAGKLAPAPAPARPVFGATASTNPFAKPSPTPQLAQPVAPQNGPVVKTVWGVKK